MNALLGTTLLVAIAALVIRRSAFGCRWEAAPSTIVTSASLSAFLTSDFASRLLERRLHSIFGIWNFEDLWGHVAFMICAAAAVQMFMVRFGDDDMCRDLYNALVRYPVALSIPLLITCRAMGETGQHYAESLDQAEPGFWMSGYWFIVLTVTFWLLTVAGAFALRLRFADGYSRANVIILNLYILAIGASMLFLTALSIQVYTPHEIHDPVWLLAYIAIICWSAAPAYSWWCKARPLTILPPDQLANS